jgi:chaperonin cofactor prefoldin
MSQSLKSKVLANEIQSQAQMLENRINLLKKQENDMLKKIEKTKQKATQAFRAKTRIKKENKYKKKL